MNPCNLPVDPFGAAAGEVMVLRQMFGQHSSAEVRVVPRDLVGPVPYVVILCSHIPLSLLGKTDSKGGP